MIKKEAEKYGFASFDMSKATSMKIEERYSIPFFGKKKNILKAMSTTGRIVHTRIWWP